MIPTPTASPTASVSMSVSASPSVTPSVSASASITASVSPSVSPATPTPVPSGCLWTGSGADDSEEDDDKADDDIVMDLSRVPSLASGWTPCYRDGFSGLIYKRQRNLGIDPRPDQNGSNTDPMCFSVYPRRSGTYFLTSLSYAPHNTEHNDAWVSSSHGFELWRRSVRHSIVSPGKWRKAYQNFGKKGIAMFMKTIDHNGHRFLVPNVKKGEVFKVCLAGRSFRYEMFRLVLIKCRGAFCTGGVYRDVFQRVERTEPRCLMKEEIEREREEEMTAMVTPEAR